MIEENLITKEVKKGVGKIGATMSKPVLALIAIIFGTPVIVFRDLLQWIVGLYFELRRR